MLVKNANYLESYIMKYGEMEICVMKLCDGEGEFRLKSIVCNGFAGCLI